MFLHVCVYCMHMFKFYSIYEQDREDIQSCGTVSIDAYHILYKSKDKPLTHYEVVPLKGHHIIPFIC